MALFAETRAETMGAAAPVIHWCEGATKKESGPEFAAFKWAYGEFESRIAGYVSWLRFASFRIESGRVSDR